MAGNVTCILDALDECDEHVQLIEALEDFCLRHRSRFSASKLKFLLTSRPYFDIRTRFNRLLQASDNIELAGNDESASIKTEIDLVIKYKVAQFASGTRLKKSVSNHLVKRLLETENRTYLWLRLIWEIIEKSLSGTTTAMNKLIDELPSSIQDSYETLLRKCPDAPFAKKVLQILLVACRPLKLEEIDHAINVNEQTSSYADLELEGSPQLQQTLPSRCGLMVSIVESKVYFIHQTVKEFLLSEAGTQARSERTWQHSLDLDESHQLMAEICLRSICFSDIELDQVNMWNALLPERDRKMEPNRYCQGKDFMSYSAIYWAEHFRGQNDTKGMRFIEQCLETSDCDSDGNTLHAASLGGHEEIVQMLLDRGADVNVQGMSGTVLRVASCNDHETLVQILLDNGADLNAQGRGYSNALTDASNKGHEKVVQILLNNGANVNAQDEIFSNALQEASCKGHEKIVQILLDNGANVNAQGGLYGNALQGASLWGHEKVVQMLLDKGADVNAQGEHGNALARASSEGYTEVVQMLLDKGANVHAQDGDSDTALQVAAFFGCEKTMQLLLDNGADINDLRAATFRDDTQVLRFLSRYDAVKRGKKRILGLRTT